MSNEIKIKISSEVTGTGLKDTKKDLHDVETASDKAGNAVAKLGREIDKTDGKRIKVGIEIPRDDLGKFLPKDQKAKVKVGVEPDNDSGTSFMKRFGDLAGAAAGPVAKLLGNHVGITVGAAAGAAAAPALVSAIGGALAGGVGAGVIGAGVALVVKNDKGIQAAGKQIGKDFMTAMGEEAKVLTGPVRESLGVLEDAGGRITKSWGEAFDALADEVVPFTEDVVDGVERLSDAMTNVAKDSGPAIKGLGDSWKLLADGVGDSIEILADGGPEAADNLRLVSGAIADLTRYTAVGLDQLGKMANNELLTGPVLPMLREHYKEAADETGRFALKTQGAAVHMENAAEAARGERAALEGLSTELKAQSDPVFAIIKAQNDLKKAQKDTAKATKEHGENSAEAEAALQAQAEAALALEGNIGKLGETFDGKMTPAMRATFKAAGLTDGAIDRLEKQFRDAKKAGDKFSSKYQASVNVKGVTAATNDLYALRRIANSLDGRVIDIAMRITGVSNVSKQAAAIRKNFAHGGIVGAASGGMRSGLTLVGEEGPELAEIAPGGRVHSNPDTMRMLAAGGGGGGGGGPITVNLVVDGRVLAQATVEPTRAMVQRQASGNAQQFWGQGS